MPMQGPVQALGVFGFVFIGRFFVMLPQDVVIVLTGYYASVSDINPGLAIVAAMLAVVLSDLCIYAASRAGGPLLRRLLEGTSESKRTRFAERLKVRPGRAIFVTRLIMGVRIVVPIVAGSTRFPLRRFFLWNGAAVMIYVPALFLLGYLLHDRIEAVLEGVTILGHLTVTAAVIAVAVLIGHTIRRHRRLKKIGPIIISPE